MLAKANGLAARVGRKALEWLHKFNESTLGKLTMSGLDALFDTPADMRKLGYNPNNSSGTANPKVPDAVSNLITEHLGFGISGHLVAKVASTVLVKTLYWAKRKLKSATEDTGDDPIKLWAAFVHELFAKLAEEFGTDGVPSAEEVEKRLRGLLDGQQNVA